MIKPEELAQPGWYIEHFGSKDLLVFISSVEHSRITIKDYDENTLSLTEEKAYKYYHLKNYAYTYICAPIPLSEFENLYPEYFI